MITTTRANEAFAPNDDESRVVDGDAATYLEELVVEQLVDALPVPSSSGLLIELVGPHLRFGRQCLAGPVPQTVRPHQQP